VNGKLVILAGGVSSRMKKSLAAETTDGNIDSKLLKDAESKTKSMIRVGENERPFLDYLFFNAKKVGITEVVIVISEKDNSIQNHYNENPFDGLKISYATQIIPAGREKPLGTADALYQALKVKPEWKGSTFVVCNSDNIYSQEALKLLLNSEYPNALIDYDRNGFEFEKERIEKFAVTKKDQDGFLLDIIEKPSKEEIASVTSENGFVGVSMNIFRFNYDMIYHYLEIVPMNPARLEKELPTAIKMMIHDYPKSLFTYPLYEHVPDLTSKNDILIVKKYLEINFPNF
jgi:NDP-sugar pyrophosphorylase family protein